MRLVFNLLFVAFFVCSSADLFAQTAVTVRTHTKGRRARAGKKMSREKRMAANWNRLSKELSLSPAQRKKAKPAFVMMSDRMLVVKNNTAKTTEQKRKSYLSIRKTFDQKFLVLLTPAQKKKYALYKSKRKRKRKPSQAVKVKVRPKPILNMVVL